MTLKLRDAPKISVYRDAKLLAVYRDAKLLSVYRDAKLLRRPENSFSFKIVIILYGDLKRKVLTVMMRVYTFGF